MHDYYENALRQTFREEVAGVHPQYVLPTILNGARRREAWLLVLVATLGALLTLIGLLLVLAQDQPAPTQQITPQTTPHISTRPWEA